MKHRKHLLGIAVVGALITSGTAFAQSGAAPAPAQAPAPASPITDPPKPFTEVPPAQPVGERPDTHGSAVGATASAVPPGTPPGQAVSTVAHGVRDFKKLDVDGDGQLSSAETAAVEGLTFTDVDADANLSLSQAEFDAYLRANAVATTDEDDD